MMIFLHRLRERGWPIPKYQFGFKEPVAGELIVVEARDSVLNRHTRVAKLNDPNTGAPIGIPSLLDVQLTELTRERMILSGIERIEDGPLLKIEDFAQTWVCWLAR